MSQPSSILGTSYEAEASGNTPTGHAQVGKCYYCSEGEKVNHISPGSTLQFNNIRENSAGNYKLRIYYVNGTADRMLYVSVNNGPALALMAVSMRSWNVIGILTVTIQLRAGNNTIKLFNPFAHAPDIDRIVI